MKTKEEIKKILDNIIATEYGDYIYDAYNTGNYIPSKLKTAAEEVIHELTNLIEALQ